MQHSIPIVSWHTCTRDAVRSAFFPPAPLVYKQNELLTERATHQVMSMNSGPNPRIRSIRSYRFCKPYRYQLNPLSWTSSWGGNSFHEIGLRSLFDLIIIRTWTYLSCSRREEFETPERPAFSLRLRKLLSDLHDGFSRLAEDIRGDVELHCRWPTKLKFLVR
jgi:hypothetical protein